MDMKPDPVLRPYIDRYWVWEDEGVLPNLFPGTGGELIFQYGGSPIRFTNANTSKKYTLLTTCGALFQSRHNQFHLTTDETVKIISIRFRHGALRHFCRELIVNLVNQVVNASDLWGDEARTVGMQLTEVNSIQQRIMIIESFVLDLLQKEFKQIYQWFDRAIHDLYYKDHVCLNTLIRRSDISKRYFQKIFKMNCGTSPKHFQCIARFEKTIRYLLLEKRTDYIFPALEQGYYDQAHFIKHFKQFTQMTPREYLREENFKTHFYNNSLSY